MPLFRRRTRPASTGHAGDDQLLATMARQSDLTQPRHWLHYLYFADDHSAHQVAAEVAAAGWTTQVVDRAATDSECGVVAERHDVISPDTVRRTRAFFEALAAQHRGGEYDGWEARS